MSEAINERLVRLLKTMRLKQIRPVSIHSDLLGQMAARTASNGEMNLSWKQAYADGDPVVADENVRIFRPKYEVTVNSQETPIFRHVSAFFIAFHLMDVSIFEESW